MDIDNSLEEFKAFLKNIYIEVDKLKQKQSELDKKEQDILHKIELSSFNACEGYKLCKILKTVREERRLIKDRLQNLSILTPLSNKVNQTIKSINKHKQSKNNRKYAPRILKGLFENPKEFYNDFNNYK